MRPERRRAARFPFTATAEIIAEKQDARSPSKVTDLSLHGCYVEMTNPLPQGTNVLIEIYTETEFLETPATVAYFDPQQGMGLTFGEMHGYFASVLNRWLEKADGRTAR
jgi:hypothetical protein